MKRKFITNLALLIFLNLLIKPFWVFGIDRKVQNIVGAEEYGFYFSLLSFSILLNIFLDAGITNLNNRSISRNHGLLPTYLSRIVPIRFLLAIAYTVITLSTGLFIGYSTEQFYLLFALIFNQFLLSFIIYLRSNISGLQLLRADSLISVLDRTLMIIMCSLLIWGNVSEQAFRIEWFVYAQTLSYILTSVVALIIVLSRTGRIRLQLNLKYTIKTLKQSYPYALLALFMSVFNRIDLVMLERMIPEGKEQAGIYVQSFRILDAAAMFAFLFAGLLFPIFSRMIKQKKKVDGMAKLSYTLLIIPAISVSIICSVYSDNIINLLYNEHILYSSRIFSILIFSFVFISTTYIFGTLLTANGSLKDLNILAGITVIINLIFNIILIPRYLAMGPAISSLVSQGFFASGLILLSKKAFNLKLNLKFIIQIIIFTFLLAGTGIFTHTYFINKFTGIIVSSFLAIIYVWLLRIITPSSIIKIIKTKSEVLG